MSEQQGRPSAGAVHLSIVSPVYRAEDCLDELVRRISAAASPLTDSFEIVLVNDGSPDNSWAVIERLAAKDPRVRGVALTRNFGQHHAITAGLRESRGEWVVVMDCDLQDRPEEIPRLYERAMEGNECVMARRVHRKDTAGKVAGSRLFYKVFNYLTDLHFDGTVANFSIISRRVANALTSMPESVRFYGGFLQWMGFANSFLDVQHDSRFAGESSYTFLRLLRFGSDIILAYSDKPLRICVTVGFGIAVVSVIAGIGYLIRALFFGIPVMGWASLIITLFFSTGAIIFTLGILGLYIARIFAEVKGRPHYLVRSRTFAA
ncbi:MAG TPA: glycosyltransferase family 2 protein [Gemmatimonadaceae bacterium]|nr:glycosyltransferase family 2 protein [Gemmatimonadaceae bacterium]